MILRPLPLSLILLGAAGAALAVWASYVEPKLSLFEPDRVAQNFRQMDAIFPAVAVPPSSTPSEIPRGDHVPLDSLAPGLMDFLMRSQTTSFLVVHRGELVHESYWHGYGPESRATSFSVAKSVVSALIGAALAEGAIRDLDDPLADYCPELATAGFGTIRDALQMSSGVAFSEDYDDRSTDAFTIYDRMYVWMQGVDGITTTFGGARPPGDTFRYASIETHALAMVLEAATGESLARYLHRKIWEPLGMEGSATWLADVHGEEVGFWGLNARPRDFAKIGMLYLRGGMWGDTRLIPASWIAASTQPGRADLARGQIDRDWGYGFQWWLPRGGDDFAAIGIWGQFLYVDPLADLVAVKTSADPEFKAHEFEAITWFRSIGDGLGRRRALSKATASP